MDMGNDWSWRALSLSQLSNWNEATCLAVRMAGQVAVFIRSAHIFYACISFSSGSAWHCQEFTAPLTIDENCHGSLNMTFPGRAGFAR